MSTHLNLEAFAYQSLITQSNACLLITDIYPAPRLSQRTLKQQKIRSIRLGEHYTCTSTESQMTKFLGILCEKCLWNRLRSMSSGDMWSLRCLEHISMWPNSQVMVLRVLFSVYVYICSNPKASMSKSNSDAALNIDPVWFMCLLRDALRIKDRPEWKEKSNPIILPR